MHRQMVAIETSQFDFEHAHRTKSETKLLARVTEIRTWIQPTRAVD